MFYDGLVEPLISLKHEKYHTLNKDNDTVGFMITVTAVF